MKSIKTFEDACNATGIDPEKVLPDVSAFPAPHQKALTAFAKLVIIADAVNDGWTPDWNDRDQKKYYPWFDMEKDSNNPSGFRLTDVFWTYAGSDVGSRLCFQTMEKAKYAATQFIGLYRDLMVLQN